MPLLFDSMIFSLMAYNVFLFFIVLFSKKYKKAKKKNRYGSSFSTLLTMASALSRLAAFDATEINTSSE